MARVFEVIGVEYFNTVSEGFRVRERYGFCWVLVCLFLISEGYRFSILFSIEIFKMSFLESYYRLKEKIYKIFLRLVLI